MVRFLYSAGVGESLALEMGGQQAEGEGVVIEGQAVDVQGERLVVLYVDREDALEGLDVG